MLEILLVDHVEDRDAMLLSRLLSEQWHQGIGAAAIEQRLKSGNPFFVVYDIATEEDAREIESKYNIRHDVGERILIGILETVVLGFDSYRRLGKRGYEDYNRITQKNYIWKEPAKDQISLLLADITFLKSRWGKDIDKESKNGYTAILVDWISKRNPDKVTAADATIEYVKSYAKTRFKHIWTLTPWKEIECEHGILMHEDHGAARTEYIISGCRPDYFITTKKHEQIMVPDAMISQYF